MTPQHASRIARSSAAFLAAILVFSPLAAQDSPPDDRPSPAAGEQLYNVKIEDMEVLLHEYSKLTGRTLLEAPSIPKAKISLRSQTRLTREEYLSAIQSILAMNNVAILEVGEKFAKVVPIAVAQQEAMAIRLEDPETPPPDSDDMENRIVTVQYITLAEAQQAVQALKHGYAKVQALERTNSLLLTDTTANINRMVEIIRYLDQPVEVKEVLHILPVLHTKASEIKKKIEEIIKETQPNQAAEQRPTVPAPRTSGPPGVIRAPPAATRQAQADAPDSIDVELAEKGIIQGQVRIVADDRANILLIITNPSNMPFFENILKALDIATEPDVLVRVFRLEFAEAESVAGMLNDLIGAAKKAEDAARTGPVPEGAEVGDATALRDYVESMDRGAPPDGAPGDSKSKVGELSADNIKILSDKRTNALIIMASKNDLATLEEIVSDMDIMLSQVLVEAVILDVSLSGHMKTGFDWVQRAMIAYNKDADGNREATAAFAGAFGGNEGSPRDTRTLTTVNSLPGGTAGLTYYFTLFGLNMDGILKMAADDSKVRILSTPVILTTDNKEAKITDTRQIYVYKGTQIDANGNQIPQTELKDVGLELTVTPHINQSRFVMMDVVQTMSGVSGSQTIDDNTWDTTSARNFTASILVKDRETIVLGGLVETSRTKKGWGIPVISDIPLLGRLVRSDEKSDDRREVIVFITPYVLDTPAEIADETDMRRQSVHAEDMWSETWSHSRLTQQDELDRAEQALQQSEQRRSWWQRFRNRNR